MSSTITIACPIRDRAWILPQYLKHIYDLNYPKKLINIVWVINQSTDHSETLLREFKSKHYTEYNEIRIINYFGNSKVPKDERFAHIRNKHIYSHLAEMRNAIFENSVDTDYLFSCDSDILVQPDTITKLLQHGKDVCAGIIWNGYLRNPDKPWLFPNILRKQQNGFEHISNSYVKRSPELSETKLVKVDATGALVLISKDVVKNTRYGFHEQGEDLFWALDCANKGYEMYADYSVFGRHIMSEKYINGRLQ